MSAITLLVPCYNAAKFLPRLWEAVRAQTVPFTAVLAYDDGSTDDTREVAGRLGLPMLGPNPNRGVAHARNCLAQAAETEWIHFHDADDLIAPRYVEKLSPWCAGESDAVTCDADWIDETTRKVQIAWRYDAAELARDPYRHLLERAMGLNNSILRRSAWLQVGGCDESLAIWEDADVHIRLARSRARFHHVPEVLTWSLRREESFSHDYRKGWRCRLAALGNYVRNPSAARVADVLARETERAAEQLAVLGERDAAKRAVALCRQVGGRPPTTRNPLVRALRPFIPAVTLLRWQAAYRRRRSADC